MSFDLLNIGAAGVRANSELLQTTSKNIANLNTKGYIRERTEHGTMIGGMVGRGETVRLLNQFAQQQLNRDISNQSYYEQFVTEASRVDTLFAQDSNSLSKSINSMFNNLQSAINLPSSTTNRSLFMTGAQGLVDQMDRLSGIVVDQNSIVNEQLDIFSEEANNLVQKISELNKQVASKSALNLNNVDHSVLNERDQAIKELAELVDIETLDGENGEKLVFLGTGDALVMQGGAFNLFAMKGNPDPNHKELILDIKDKNVVQLELDSGSLKGKIGGLLAFRDEVLIPAQNQLGQIGLALADAFNQQNRLGMDLDGNIGGDIFKIPTVGGFAYSENTGTAALTATLEPGRGNELPATDFQVTYTSATTVEITAVDAKGNPIGTPTTGNIAGGVITGTGDYFGLQMNVTGSGATGDRFLVKLNQQAATGLELATQRPEALALASPIRTEKSADNNGTATISAGVVTDTDPATSAFTAGTPPTLNDGPYTLTKTANANEYTLTSNSGTTHTFTAPADGKDILSGVGAAPAPFDNLGFTFDIEGTPNTGDSFEISFNTGGFDDNRNGAALDGLKSSDLVRQNVESTGSTESHKTFNEAYADIVTGVGVITNQAKTNGAAFEALANQSSAWFESLSGVNLDEEAANLLRFQQSYSASAQVISAARTVFDTLLSAAR
ncbi:flagellar hook-associated protein FlgK [Pseudoalteromonas sp. GCY]|uniref:flagellar hook-associated protein FlgK n=1 Tax=Pseudoalteromonas TaxID=53246 RepID=UPI000BFEB36F|nr:MULTISPECIES: flagellar hook-associated protein FlgK [Pseudoalteromonas]MCG9769465.1 flagellar hook-associated protein FlgK [Pseudoalteromonas piscicida]PHI36910.1 flagellar hook-associated protein FlgK [Pseudoalteromonas sp. GCY]QQQ68302.1 flagellar hook-associated protein FlgK [Pseudoalteromonas sp. GCY]QUI62995.1 flagellar hook-associated protein FlgK [Pseudoalteromonas sp. A22]USE68661.1 flagellar hook-associated protein FlgK [Pseudoalteromonas flavipulchra]